MKLSHAPSSPVIKRSSTWLQMIPHNSPSRLSPEDEAGGVARQSFPAMFPKTAGEAEVPLPGSVGQSKDALQDSRKLSLAPRERRSTSGVRG